MKINQETVHHLAKLSNFAITDEETTRLMVDIKEIVGYISQLDELNTDGIEPTYQVFEMENIWRSDDILPQETNREQLLALTQEVYNHQIKVPKVL